MATNLIAMTDEELALVIEGLDALVYWECADDLYRNNGYVYDKRDPDSGVISDDPDRQERGEAAQRLLDRLERLGR